MSKTNKKKNAKPKPVIDNTKISNYSVFISAAANRMKLEEDLTSHLAEEVTCKLREVIQKCEVMVRQSKRNKLTTSDVKAVFQTSDVPPIYGHVRAEEPINFFYRRREKIYGIEDDTVDLIAMALSETKYVQKGEPYVKAAWIHPDAVEKEEDEDEEGVCSTSFSRPTPAKNRKKTREDDQESERTIPKDQPPDHLIRYYVCVSKVILGNSEKNLQTALKDLKSSSKIFPIVPYIINMVILGLSKIIKEDPTTFKRQRLLRVIEALTKNKFVDPYKRIQLRPLVMILLKCILDPVFLEGSSPKCNYELRNLAAFVLWKVDKFWCRRNSELHEEILQRLRSTLLDNSSLRSHYGALKTLCVFGHTALDSCFWPYLEQYLVFLDTLNFQRNINSSEVNLSPQMRFQQHSDLIEIEGCILDAAEFLYCMVVHDQSQLQQNITRLERILETYFGDSLCARRSYSQISKYGRMFIKITVIDPNILFSRKKKNKSQVLPAKSIGSSTTVTDKSATVVSVNKEPTDRSDLELKDQNSDKSAKVIQLVSVQKEPIDSSDLVLEEQNSDKSAKVIELVSVKKEPMDTSDLELEDQNSDKSAKVVELVLVKKEPIDSSDLELDDQNSDKSAKVIDLVSVKKETIDSSDLELEDQNSDKSAKVIQLVSVKKEPIDRSDFELEDQNSDKSAKDIELVSVKKEPIGSSDLELEDQNSNKSAKFIELVSVKKEPIDSSDLELENQNSDKSAKDIEFVSVNMEPIDSSDMELEDQNLLAATEISAHIPVVFHSNSDNNPPLSDGRLEKHISSGMLSALELPIKQENYSDYITVNLSVPSTTNTSKKRRLDPAHSQLVCTSDYFSKICQVGSIGKSKHKKPKNVTSKNWSVDVMTVL